MTRGSQHLSQPHLGQPRLERSVSDGVTATFADDVESILVTVARRADPASADADAGGPMLTVVEIDGDIDHDTAPFVRLGLSHALTGRTPVCCDLSRVTFFGAAAAHAVLSAHSEAVGLGRAFFLRGVRGTARLVLATIDPDGVVPRRAD
jgi:anti-anti-sigma regulatory factor